MIKITEQEFIKRYDALPDGIREAVLADENVNMLWTIGEAHHLSEERIRNLAGVVGYIVLGVVHIEDLPKEIANESGVDRRLAEELAREIKLKILNPIIPQLQQLYHYGPAGTAAPPAGTVAAPATSPQPAIMKPVFAPSPSDVRHQTSDIRSDTPFILHEEQKEIEPARPWDETLVRPSFFDPPSREAPEGQGGFEKAARLELGPSADSGQEERRKPQVGKTEEPPIRVVHYSGPQTPVDPFAPGQETGDRKQEAGPGEPRPAEPPKDIHPENIVDLKDLPR